MIGLSNYCNKKILLLVNKRTRSIFVKPCMYIIAFCVLAREHGSCAHSRSLPPKPSEAGNPGDYDYFEDPEVGGPGDDEA